MKLVCTLILIFLPVFLFASVTINDNVPEKLKKEVSDLCSKKDFISRFHLELYNSKSLVIETEDGMMRRVPLEGVTASDLLNIMETMEEDLFILREARKKESEKKSVDVPVPEEKVDDEKPVAADTPYIWKKKRSLFEFFPYAKSGNRYHIGVSISSEEDGAGSVEASAGLLFLRFGPMAKKGLNVDFNYRELSWFGAGGFLTADLFRLYDFYLAAGWEALYYRVNDHSYERDAALVALRYSRSFFFAEARARITRNEVYLITGGRRYRTDRIGTTLTLGFRF